MPILPHRIPTFSGPSEQCIYVIDWNNSLVCHLVLKDLPESNQSCSGPSPSQCVNATTPDSYTSLPGETETFQTATTQTLAFLQTTPLLSPDHKGPLHDLYYTPRKNDDKREAKDLFFPHEKYPPCRQRTAHRYLPTPRGRAAELQVCTSRHVSEVGFWWGGGHLSTSPLFFSFHYLMVSGCAAMI